VLVSVSIVDCGFMPLQGELAGADPVRPLGRPGQPAALDQALVTAGCWPRWTRVGGGDAGGRSGARR
jgi:hypothetical protein